MAGEEGGHALVLAGAMGMQDGLGHAGFGDDPVDVDGVDAFGVEEPAGDLRQAFSGARGCDCLFQQWNCGFSGRGAGWWHQR